MSSCVCDSHQIHKVWDLRLAFLTNNFCFRLSRGKLTYADGDDNNANNTEARDDSDGTIDTVWDSRVVMVQERLLEALLANPSTATSSTNRQSSSSSLSSGIGSGNLNRNSVGSASGSSPSGDVGLPEEDGTRDSAAAAPSTPDGRVGMEVEGGEEHESVILPEGKTTCSSSSSAEENGRKQAPGAVQVVASMVNTALKVATTCEQVWYITLCW